MKTGYYAVARGRCTGVYKTWSECERQVKGYRNARPVLLQSKLLMIIYRKFIKQSDALAFILKNSISNHAGDGKSSQSELSSTTELQKLSSSKPSFSQEENIWEGIPIVYTDGACSFNGHVGATAGIGVYWGEQHVDNISEPLLRGPPTNNRAELEAVIRAVQMAIQRRYHQLIVRTDSNLLIQTMNSWIHGWQKNGWKTSNGTTVKNQDLIIELNGLLKNINVRFEHVAGHVGIYGNEKADQLAREGALHYHQTKS
ncbi:RNase H family protein [Brugia malayi]|uniref:Ribonuclease H1 n=2 Tax=Brugia TaxID=6278 RepID=A0A4E9FBD8_BRUMA|nr:RNase H family protein [Brugia malayi]VIO93546.1 RNase H family protein [Brugia malayi]